VGYLLLVTGGLQVLDGVMSYFFTNRGWVQELNPLLTALVSESIFPVLKIVGAGATVFALWLIGKRFPRLATFAATTVTVFYLAVIGWNLQVLIISA